MVAVAAKKGATPRVEGAAPTPTAAGPRGAVGAMAGGAEISPPNNRVAPERGIAVVVGAAVVNVGAAKGLGPKRESARDMPDTPKVGAVGARVAPPLTAAPILTTAPTTWPAALAAAAMERASATSAGV